MKAVLVCAHGTSTKAVDTYHKYIEYLSGEYSSIHLAFTSNRLAEKAGSGFMSVSNKVQELYRSGVRELYINSLHIIGGGEYDKLTALDNKYEHMNIFVTNPLFHDDSIGQVFDILKDSFRADAENILAVHGTKYENKAYVALAEMCKDMDNVHVAGAENIPHFEDVYSATASSTASVVHVIPCMYVAGFHVDRDIMGDDEQSWKSRYKRAGKGLTCDMINGSYAGLGDRVEIMQILADKLKNITGGTF